MINHPNFKTTLLIFAASIFFGGCIKKPKSVNKRNQASVDSSRMPNSAGLVESPEASVLLSPAADAVINSTRIVVTYSESPAATQYWLGVGTSEQAVSVAPYGDIARIPATKSTLTLAVNGIVPNGRPIFIRLWTRLGAVWNSRLYTFETGATDNSLADQIGDLRKESDLRIAEIKIQNDALLKKIAELKNGLEQKIDESKEEIKANDNNNTDLIQQSLSNMQAGLTAMQASVAINLQTIQQSRDTLLEKIAQIKTASENHSIALAELTSAMMSLQSQIELMDGSILYIESQISQLDEIYNAVQDRSDEVIEEIIYQSDGIKATLSTITGTIAATRLAVDQLSEDIGADAAQIYAGLISLESDVNTNLDEILRLQTLVGSGGGSSNIRQINNYLEVFYAGVWSGVCDDSFDSNDAAVACWQLGYEGSSDYSTGISSSSSDFWLDDLGCSGSETSLFNCPHSEIGVENCSSSEHVRVTCY